VARYHVKTVLSTRCSGAAHASLHHTPTLLNAYVPIRPTRGMRSCVEAGMARISWRNALTTQHCCRARRAGSRATSDINRKSGRYLLRPSRVWLQEASTQLGARGDRSAFVSSTTGMDVLAALGLENIRASIVAWFFSTYLTAGCTGSRQGDGMRC